MTISANLSLQSTAWRHALRLATALAFATAVYQSTGLPRGYWFPMTTLLVLKPEYRETFVTGIARMLGTLAGAALAPLLVAMFGSHPAAVTAWLLAFVWSGYAFFRANYVVFTICITGYVVMLLYLSGVPGPVTAKFRALDTILGGALALTVYRLWPTWESSQLREVLALELEALGRDSDLMLGTYVDPSRWDPQSLQQSRAEARPLERRGLRRADAWRTAGQRPLRSAARPQSARGIPTICTRRAGAARGSGRSAHASETGARVVTRSNRDELPHPGGRPAQRHAACRLAAAASDALDVANQHRPSACRTDRRVGGQCQHAWQPAPAHVPQTDNAHLSKTTGEGRKGRLNVSLVLKFCGFCKWLSLIVGCRR
jgi:uncharacterized membrane protein YccC